MSKDKEYNICMKKAERVEQILKQQICTTESRLELRDIIEKYQEFLYEKAWSYGKNILENAQNIDITHFIHDLIKQRIEDIFNTNEQNTRMNEIKSLLFLYPSLLVKEFTMVSHPKVWLKDLALDSLNEASIDAAKPYLIKLLKKETKSEYFIGDVRKLVTNYPRLLTEKLDSYHTASEISLNIYGHEMFVELYKLAKTRLCDISISLQSDYDGRLNEIELLLRNYPQLSIENIPGTINPIVKGVDKSAHRIFSKEVKNYLCNLISDRDISSVDKVGCAEKAILLYPEYLSQRIDAHRNAIELSQFHHNDDLIKIFSDISTGKSQVEFCDSSTQAEDITAEVVLLALDSNE